MTGDEGKGMVLQERDRHWLRELGNVLRVADRDQAMIVAGFGSISRTNRRLRSLTEAGLLKRFVMGTSGAGQKHLYSLSQKGALLVDVPYRGLRRRNDEALVADFFVEHQLAINEIYCATKYRATLPLGIVLKEWRAFYAAVVPTIDLIPDGYFVLQTPRQPIAAFLEVDLGHERRAVWLKKVRMYVELAASGEFARRFREKEFGVLVITTTHRRLESLRITTASVISKLFWFTTFELLRTQGISGKIWVRPKSTNLQPFIEESYPT